jgi:hypothetical protein
MPASEHLYIHDSNIFGSREFSNNKDDFLMIEKISLSSRRFFDVKLYQLATTDKKI